MLAYFSQVGNYKTCSMDEEPKETPYSIVPITVEDSDKVVHFLRTFFFRDEPLNVAVGLLDEPGATCKELEEYCVNCIPEGELIYSMILLP